VRLHDNPKRRHWVDASHAAPRASVSVVRLSRRGDKAVGFTTKNFRGSSPVRDKAFFLLPSVQTNWGPPGPLFCGYRGAFSAEVKNTWSPTSTALCAFVQWFLIKDRENFSVGAGHGGEKIAEGTSIYKGCYVLASVWACLVLGLRNACASVYVFAIRQSTKHSAVQSSRCIETANCVTNGKTGVCVCVCVSLSLSLFLRHYRTYRPWSRSEVRISGKRSGTTMLL
jgi:hypothetical protein